MPDRADFLPLATIDILGHEPSLGHLAGNALLAYLSRAARVQADVRDEAADADAADLEHEQTDELAVPGDNLLDVALKLALALRLAHAVGGSGVDSDAMARLVGSALADVIALRQAELRRRELLEGRE